MMRSVVLRPWPGVLFFIYFLFFFFFFFQLSCVRGAKWYIFVPVIMRPTGRQTEHIYKKKPPPSFRKLAKCDLMLP